MFCPGTDPEYRSTKPGAPDQSVSTIGELIGPVPGNQRIPIIKPGPPAWFTTAQRSQFTIPAPGRDGVWQAVSQPCGWRVLMVRSVNR